ncbi:MAG TPA: hypothetical protein DEQ20_05000 [Desulfobulbaceae bacterium]|nr:MAG: hypothetical protein A2520_03265 [Deltaproteobacteria bacterium RIFOXYD12_FULL_53_23]HCC54269.1 hypothetical protein [Desulfobulbaceae bacterium]
MASYIDKKYFIHWTLALTLFVALGMLVVVDGYLAYRRTLATEQHHLQTQAGVIKDNLNRQLVATFRSLQDILNDIQLEKRTQPTDLFFLTHRLIAVETAIPGIRTLIILNKKGLALASNRQELVGKDFSHRDYFQRAIAGGRPGALYLTPPFLSILNVHVMSLSMTMYGPGGEIEGVVTASLDPEYFRTMLDSIRYADDMWLFVAHEDGEMFMTVPEKRVPTGKYMDIQGTLFRQHNENGGRETIKIGKCPQTGANSMVVLKSIHPLEAQLDKGLVLSIHRPLQRILAGWHWDMIIRLSGLLITLIITVVFLRAYHQRDRLAVEQEILAQGILLENERKYRGIFEQVQDVVYQTDTSGILLDISPSVQNHLGYAREEILGTSYVKLLVDPDDKIVVEQKMDKQGYIKDYEIVFKHKNGMQVTAVLNAHFIFDPATGAKTGMDGIWHNITERKRKENLLTSLAFVDTLTQIANRRRFDEELVVETSRGQREKTPLSLVMVDVDHFKTFNDHYGHPAGDLCLQSIAKAMAQELTRPGDLLARYGGEEFVVLLPNTGANGARHVAERLRERVAALRIPHACSSVAPQVTISLGHATLQPNEIPEARKSLFLVQEADAMLYEAKGSGRNRVCGQRET